MRAVACTTKTANENLCLTGADDGVPRLYNLDTLAPAWKDGETPKAEFNGRHTGQIVSVAFAPNGKYCATADNRDIILWDVTTGEQKYKFAPHHKAPITYIQFTPQCALVSEARRPLDGTLESRPVRGSSRRNQSTIGITMWTFWASIRMAARAFRSRTRTPRAHY